MFYLPDKDKVSAPTYLYIKPSFFVYPVKQDDTKKRAFDKAIYVAPESGSNGL